MRIKAVVSREQASREVDDVIAHYLGEQAEPAALGFIDALAQAYAHISRPLRRDHHATPMS